ncbi:MAG: triose-phosphate isomerase [Myxococcales bacterium]
MTRRALVAGNWKLHKTLGEAQTLVRELAEALPAEPAAEVVVAPVFTAIAGVRDALREAGAKAIQHAAQDVYWEPSGAFTGEVSAPMLADLGCSHVIVGHSERRQLFGERDEDVRRKAAAVLEHDMTPIVCVGETLEQREAGETESVVLGQVRAALQGLDAAGLGRVVTAYEPIWAIGTGRTAAPSDAQEVHAAIRKTVRELGGDALADGMRILYGGSVKPGNAAELMAQPDIDGALVGGASLQAESFAAIVAAAP